jgi:hypothetical protein
MRPKAAVSDTAAHFKCSASTVWTARKIALADLAETAQFVANANATAQTKRRRKT